MTPLSPIDLASPLDALDLEHDDAHFVHLHHATPDFLLKASAQKRDALKRSAPSLEDWHASTPRRHHAHLRDLNAQHWTAQNQVDRLLTDLKDVDAFAAPLLTAALKDQYGLTVDVKSTFMRLYIPLNNPWFGFSTGAKRIWTVSLLDAALHNFEHHETDAEAFGPDSCFITQPDEREQFDTLPDLTQALSIAAFITLCRTLDLGAQYQEHLEHQLGVNDSAAAATLRLHVESSQKAALKAALLHARMKNDIQEDLYRLISGLIDGLRGMRLNGESLHSHTLSLLSSPLQGIVVFAPDLHNIHHVSRLVVYVPNDPEHPIKEYASSAGFAAELTRQLRDTDYQQFFSRFIHHKERGRFFQKLQSQLTRFEFHPHQYGDSCPAWREVAIEQPDLQLRASIIQLPLWQQQFEDALNKILNDGQSLAVPTARVDQQARWAFWDSLMNIASTLLTIASFVVTPFVPFLGELMLGYMAYQFLDETFEGIIEWAQGQRTEAFLHLMDAVESLIQTGTFAAGGLLVAGEFRNVLPRQVVSFIDRFKPVSAPNGKTLYWKPDLGPYEHNIALPAGSIPDQRGLHSHQGKTLLPLDGKVFAVRPDPAPNVFRIEHPTRTDAYPPALDHFHTGTWQTELDQPQTWATDKLLRRIGHTIDQLSPLERDQALSVSGYDEEALRQFHNERRSLPPLLDDTLKRFTLDKDLRTFVEQINSPHPEVFAHADAITQLQLLTEHCPWPQKRRLRLLDFQGQTIWENSPRELPTIELYKPRPGSNDLLANLLSKLDESELKTLLNEEPGLPPRSLTARAHALRETLASIAKERQGNLFDSRYQALEETLDARLLTLIDQTPGLPVSVAQEILHAATGKELQQLKQLQIPERLMHLSRWALAEVRTTRAFEGLYLESIDNLDTHRLALHSMKNVAGWPKQLLIEIRELGLKGTLRDSVGPLDAEVRKMLVQLEGGKYQAFDQQGLSLSAPEDFYNAILQALPDEARNALDIHIGAGTKLRQAVREHPITRADLQEILSQHRPLKPVYDPNLMRLPGGTEGHRRIPFDAPTLELRALELNPALTPEQLQNFMQRLQNHPDGARTELSRLRTEYSNLRQDLHSWTAQTPLHNPVTGARLEVEAYSDAKNARLILKQMLQRCWLERTTRNDAAPDSRTLLHFAQPIIGEFPSLSADFSHVTHLSLEGSNAALGTDRFLRHFTGLRHLVIRSFSLGKIPSAIDVLPQLDQLILPECGISLDDSGQATLSKLTALTALDLYGNPLGRTPDITAMRRLTYIDLADTGITTLAEGVINHPQLLTGLFNNNQISEIPLGFFQYSAEVTAGFDFAHNPLSSVTRDRIRTHFHLFGQNLNVLSEHTDIVRIRRLYTLFDVEEANRYFYRLPGSTLEARLELTRLEKEYATLRSDLDAWTGAIPQINPFTTSPFTVLELAEEQSARDEFKALVEECWRRESEFDEINENGESLFELNLPTTIIGELPALSADFSHVSTLILLSEEGATAGADSFLRCFPKLRTLNIREFSLGDIPQSVFKMGELSALYLTECNVNLSADSVAALGEMVSLEFLDLSYNALGRTPDLRQLSHLKVLTLNNCAITAIPEGLFQLTLLDNADLSDNAITGIPNDILELPASTAEVINLRGNPFNEQSQIILTAYFKNHSMDFGIESTIEEAEMEVSSSDGSEVDE